MYIVRTNNEWHSPECACSHLQFFTDAILFCGSNFILCEAVHLTAPTQSFPCFTKAVLTNGISLAKLAVAKWKIMRLGSSKKHRNYGQNGRTVLHTKGRGNWWPFRVLSVSCQHCWVAIKQDEQGPTAGLWQWPDAQTVLLLLSIQDSKCKSERPLHCTFFQAK